MKHHCPIDSVHTPNLDRIMQDLRRFATFGTSLIGFGFTIQLLPAITRIGEACRVAGDPSYVASVVEGAVRGLTQLYSSVPFLEGLLDPNEHDFCAIHSNLIYMPVALTAVALACTAVFFAVQGYLGRPEA
jgi:uncharacterized membrane protein